MIDLRKLLAERAAQGIGTGGGLMGNQSGQPGLLGNMANINPNVLIGASIAGAGLRGINPFSAVLPAVTQAAQLQKYLTPKSSFRQLTDTEKKERGLPEDKQFQIGADGKVLQIGGTGTTVNVGASNKFRIKATDEEKEKLGYNKLDDVVVTKNEEGVIIADDLRSSLDQRLGKIGTAVEKSNLLEMDLALRNIEDEIKNLREKGYTNLPGIGIVGGRRGFTSSPEGKKLRALIQTYENLGLKKRSGAAVTPNEHGRFQEELAGSVNTSDENVFLNILKKNRDSLELQKKNTFALYRDADLEQYWNSGGLNYVNSGLNQTEQMQNNLSNIPTEELIRMLNR
jgi:hypothetical protein